MEFGMYFTLLFWMLAVALVCCGVRYLFASRETLLKNADRIGAGNPAVGRVIALFWLLAGLALVGIMSWITFGDRFPALLGK